MPNAHRELAARSMQEGVTIAEADPVSSQEGVAIAEDQLTSMPDAAAYTVLGTVFTNMVVVAMDWPETAANQEEVGIPTIRQSEPNQDETGGAHAPIQEGEAIPTIQQSEPNQDGTEGAHAPIQEGEAIAEDGLLEDQEPSARTLAYPDSWTGFVMLLHVPVYECFSPFGTPVTIRVLSPPDTFKRAPMQDKLLNSHYIDLTQYIFMYIYTYICIT